VAVCRSLCADVHACYCLHNSSEAAHAKRGASPSTGIGRATDRVGLDQFSDLRFVPETAEKREAR
jgi:hypothetical protein